MSEPDHSILLCGIRLANPVLAASGTFGYGLEFASIVDLNRLGGFVTKGLSLEPIAGNPAPRLWHTEGGMLNSIGLQNVGVRQFIADKLPRLHPYRTPVFANVFGYRAEEYVEVVRHLEDAPSLSGYEINVSCPNTEQGGILFSSEPSVLFSLIEQVRKAAQRPLIVKLSPNVASIVPFVRAAADAGANAISLINTVVSLALDPLSGRPRLGNGTGGLSGPAIKPLALRLVAEASAATPLPIIGLGGVCNGHDALEFLSAGATAVQVGTATFIDPSAPVRVARQLASLQQAALQQR